MPTIYQKLTQYISWIMSKRRKKSWEEYEKRAIFYLHMCIITKLFRNVIIYSSKSMMLRHETNLAAFLSMIIKKIQKVFHSWLIWEKCDNVNENEIIKMWIIKVKIKKRKWSKKNDWSFPCRFLQHFTSSFYARRYTKSKKKNI